jgi:hypothetical protein
LLVCTNTDCWVSGTSVGIDPKLDMFNLLMEQTDTSVDLSGSRSGSWSMTPSRQMRLSAFTTCWALSFRSLMASAQGTSIYRFQAALALFNFEELGLKDANSKLDISL